MLFDKRLEGRAKELYDKLYTVEFDAISLQKELETGKYDAATVNVAAIEYVDDCGHSYDSGSIDWNEYNPDATVPGYESSHMAEAIRLLLEYGLDPNKIIWGDNHLGGFEECNIMEQIQRVFNGHQAADSLYLLLNHGGNPNLKIDNTYLYTEPDWDIGFDTANREDMISDGMYEAKLHYWFVLVGFRADYPGAELPLKPVKGFDLSKLKEHKHFYAGVIRSDGTEADWKLCVFDRHTNREVARLSLFAGKELRNWSET